MPSFFTFAHKRADALAMASEECSISWLRPDWKVSDAGLMRPDGRFYSVRGVRIAGAAGREVASWKQPMLFTVGKGFVALIVHEPNRILVRMLAEPGNIGIEVPQGRNTRVLVAPPVQFSQSNLDHHRKALQGELDRGGRPIKPVPFADLVLSPQKVGWASHIAWEDAVEDGGRHFEKVNKYGHIRVADEGLVNQEVKKTGQPENFAWITRSVLREARAAGFLSGHMRAVMSLLV